MKNTLNGSENRYLCDLISIWTNCGSYSLFPLTPFFQEKNLFWHCLIYVTKCPYYTADVIIMIFSSHSFPVPHAINYTIVRLWRRENGSKKERKKENWHSWFYDHHFLLDLSQLWFVVSVYHDKGSLWLECNWMTQTVYVECIILANQG